MTADDVLALARQANIQIRILEPHRESMEQAFLRVVSSSAPMAPTARTAPPPESPRDPRRPRPRAPVKKGVIHDLGYARYAGERRAPSTLVARDHAAPDRLRLEDLVALEARHHRRGDHHRGVRRDHVRVAPTAGSAGSPAPADRGVHRRHGAYVVRLLQQGAFLMTMTVGRDAVVARDQRDRRVRVLLLAAGAAARLRARQGGGMVVVMARSMLLAGPLLLAAFRIGWPATPTRR
jgi:hypothetical protein